ncbi:MAG: hypothetical protein ACOYBE_05825 [Blautia sp.]|jgi:acetylornithine deacetylase/succinyl-diaminopimelate desuccinylase-like protein
MKDDVLAKKIDEAVERHKDRLVELCIRLINRESVTGQERRVQEEVRKIMEEAGMDSQPFCRGSGDKRWGVQLYLYERTCGG